MQQYLANSLAFKLRLREHKLCSKIIFFWSLFLKTLLVEINETLIIFQTNIKHTKKRDLVLDIAIAPETCN